MPLSREEFGEMVERAISRIPERFRERIKNVAILVEDEPSEAVRKKEGLGEHETLLGLYQGIPATARGGSYGIGATMPDTITLYQVPIEEAAGNDPLHIEEVIADTIWHEYAHYFGMDETEVRRREYKRRGGGQ